TLRNAAQRQLTKLLGTLGATLVRCLYGLPFGVLWLAALHLATGYRLPEANAAFAAGIRLGAVAQAAAPALLLPAQADRISTLGVAYVKSEVIRAGVWAVVLLGDRAAGSRTVAVVLAAFGVPILSPADPQRPVRALLMGWTTRSALLGLASGTGFALSAVGYR